MGTAETSRPEAFLVDLDGTLALHRGMRNPYDWQSADNDLPNDAVVKLVRALSRDGFVIVYISGRPESARSLTLSWLERCVGVSGPLLLRADGDQRRDTVVKRELFDLHIALAFAVVGVLDDRQQVVDMWRTELGLPCFQVAPGNF